MSAKGILKVITNYDLGGNDDTPVYPVTSTLGVYNSENKCLEDVLSNSAKEIEEVKTKSSANNIEISTIKTDISNLIKTLTSRIDNITNMLSNIENLWEGSIVELFYDNVNPDDDDIIYGSTTAQGTVVWDFNRHTFYNMVIENEQPKYYRWWAGAEKYITENNTPHSKIYKINDVLYYYNVDIKDLVLLNSKEYLKIESIIETATVNWYKGWPLDEPNLSESTKVVYIQNPQSDNTTTNFNGPVFALLNVSGDYLLPYEKFDSTVLVKYQDKEGNIIDGLEVSCNGDVYKYNSNTKTLELI